MARNLVNHNKLLAGGAAEYAGATGFKTGYTQQAGHTLIATATREGRTIIVVILDTYDTYGWAWQLLDQGFAIPSGDPGTGEELPEVRVSPFAERQADQLAFLRLTHGAAGADAAAAIESAEPTTTVTPATDAAGDPIAEGGATEPSAASSTPASATSASPAGDGADSGGSRGPSEGSIISLRNFVLLIVLMLATLFVLRRRAVRRQRARRLARRRATAEMMRRGGLPVVDGRYRTGTRIGPPVQSNIKVERIDPRTGPARGARSTPRGGS
ncbi:MAG: hypothetical protein M5T61_13935 [Acidimicrobiia bacterium]|nr:hypothetical protein [Acidimicrobiia bacterium]